MINLTRFAAGMSVISLLWLSGDASAQVLDKKALSLAAAKKIAASAEAEAIKNNLRMVVAVVDEDGQLIYLQRLDETQTASIDLAIQKARSAAAFKRPTKVWEDALAGGRQAILALTGAVPFEGGIPVIVDGKVVGAVGASGGTSAQDGQVAQAGAAGFAAK